MAGQSPDSSCKRPDRAVNWGSREQGQGGDSGHCILACAQERPAPEPTALPAPSQGPAQARGTLTARQLAPASGGARASRAPGSCPPAAAAPVAKHLLGPLPGLRAPGQRVAPQRPRLRPGVPRGVRRGGSWQRETHSSGRSLESQGPGRWLGRRRPFEKGRGWSGTAAVRKTGGGTSLLPGWSRLLGLGAGSREPRLQNKIPGCASGRGTWAVI